MIVELWPEQNRRSLASTPSQALRSLSYCLLRLSLFCLLSEGSTDEEVCSQVSLHTTKLFRARTNFHNLIQPPFTFARSAGTRGGTRGPEVVSPDE